MESRQEDADAELLFLDMNDLKEVNDQYGHKAGDELIIGAAQCLTETFGPEAACFRLGGDEFLVMLPGCGEDEVPRTAEELRRAVETVTPADFGYTYTSGFQATQEELDRLVDEADRRMYEEKRRNAE